MEEVVAPMRCGPTICFKRGGRARRFNSARWNARRAAFNARFCFYDGRMPNIRLPDGSIKSFPSPVTVAEVAQAIGPGLARAGLAGKVNGSRVDTSYRLENDRELAIV